MSSVLSLSPWPLRRFTTLAATLGLVLLGVWLATLLLSGPVATPDQRAQMLEAAVDGRQQSDAKAETMPIAAQAQQRSQQRLQQLLQKRSLVLGSLAFAAGLAGLLLVLTQRGWADMALAGAGLLWAVHFVLGTKGLLGLSPVSPRVLQALMLAAVALTSWYGLHLLRSSSREWAFSPPLLLRALAIGAVATWLLSLLGAVDGGVSVWIVPITALTFAVATLGNVVSVARGPGSALRSPLAAWLLASTGVVAIAFGAYEQWARMNSPVLGDTYWSAWLATRVAVLAVLAVLVALRLAQISRMLHQLGRSHRSWRSRLRLAEKDCHDLNDRLASRERHDAQRQQRDRLLRELHDELGHRWLAVQNLAKGPVDLPSPQGQALRTLIDTSLIDLRMALESLEQAPRPLSEALRELREQLQPVLQACGVTLAWAMDPRAAMLVLSPADTLQLLRIVREALEPAPAREGAALVFSLDVLDGETGRHVRLRIAELPATTGSAGQTQPASTVAASRVASGWSRLQRQATMLGAQLALEPGVPGRAGASLELVMPLSGR